MKIVINKCFGGFGLSKKAWKLLEERGFNKDEFREDPTYYVDTDKIGFRTHPMVIAVVEELGVEANGDCAKLKVVEFDPEPKIEIEDFDGQEKVIVNGWEI